MWKLLAAISSLWLLAMQQPNPSHQQLLQQADAYYAEKSFSKAYQAYLKIPLQSLPPERAAWLEFRRADTLWRSGTGQGSGDFSQARRKLEELVGSEGRETGRPKQVWAEAHLSLADLKGSANRYSSDWNQAWPHYQKALDWWAGSHDIETARRRYLEIALRAFSNQGAHPNHFHPNYSAQNNPAAIAVLEKAHSIAVEPEDRAAATYLLAYFLIHSDNLFDSNRAADYFEQLIREADQPAWGDRALFEYARWLEHKGLLHYDGQGNLQRRADPAKALQLYRRWVQGRLADDSTFYRQAKRRIEQITSSMLEVRLTEAYLPGSEIQFHLRWRNLSRLKLELFAVDLTGSIAPAPNKSGHSQGSEWFDLQGQTPLHSWTHQLPEVPKYKVGRQDVALPHRLDPGAYVLRGRFGDVQGQALVLVSRASLVLLSSRGEVTAYFCDAWDGSPLADAQLSLWEQVRVNDSLKWVRLEAVTDQQGMARFEIQGQDHRSIQAFARKGEQQAFAQTYAGGRHAGAQWTFHTITDRPVYRPGETAHWKAVARLSDPDGYLTPSGRDLVMVIRDPRNREVMRQRVTLNEFGSAWGAVELTAKMPLGMYFAEFLEPDQDRVLNRSRIFRLEEYKLPEFRVKVEIPRQDGQPQIFRPGERIEALVKAEGTRRQPAARPSQGNFDCQPRADGRGLARLARPILRGRKSATHPPPLARRAGNEGLDPPLEGGTPRGAEPSLRQRQKRQGRVLLSARQAWTLPDQLVQPRSGRHAGQSRGAHLGRLRLDHRPGDPQRGSSDGAGKRSCPSGRQSPGLAQLGKAGRLRAAQPPIRAIRPRSAVDPGRGDGQAGGTGRH